MRLVEIQAMSLEPGMFVAELDRPWLETPFSLQGFVVRDYDDIEFISKYVQHVFVDAEYKGTQTFLGLATSPTARNTTACLALKTEFQQTKVSFESATATLDKVFESLRKSRPTDISAVKEAVNPLIEGVFRNEEAVAALLRLKASGDYLYNHGISMAIWGVIVGKHIGLHRNELEKLAIGCAMCNVGMTELPAEILHTPHKLTQKQRKIVEAHPKLGAEMIMESGHVDFEIIAIIENHHERMDGSGYPRGMEGASIPLLARIAGLADTYDAMITARPYAHPKTSHEAAQELIDAKGCLFQESLVEQFIQAIGLFPTGTLVELNSGEVAIVVRQNDSRRLKPEVVVVLDETKQPKDELEIIALAHQDCDIATARWIGRELLAGSFGVNSEDYFI
ncbi:MAG: HD-GYP domain-containing protein (c-di-GMP phosphodiesterase class II) [Alcanivorax sp.]|jgi:HD-GYP domain-containing protein (c-di-GMP phosphodiesterase class II)